MKRNKRSHENTFITFKMCKSNETREERAKNDELGQGTKQSGRSDG